MAEAPKESKQEEKDPKEASSQPQDAAKEPEAPKPPPPFLYPDGRPMHRAIDGVWFDFNLGARVMAEASIRVLLSERCPASVAGIVPSSCPRTLSVRSSQNVRSVATPASNSS